MTDLQNRLNRRFTVAPMMDWTDRHCRYFHRLLSKNAVLYTEMVTTGALIHAEADRFLRYNREEQPVALQLGGSNATDLAKCTKMAEDYGYNEVNLNVGCPSDRVQNNMIGACLMAHPQLVADCLKQMQDAVTIPVTVKHRLGIDDMDSYDELKQFVETVRTSGCNVFIIHARKAILQGLSPKENRDVPPLKYEWVYQIKQEFPELEVHINGGIKSIEECHTHLQYVDGVMLGREAYQNPYILAHVEHQIFNGNLINRKDAALQMIPYIEQQMKEYRTPVKSITRHMTGLYQGMKGAKKYRQLLSTLPHQDGADASVINTALSALD